MHSWGPFSYTVNALQLVFSCPVSFHYLLTESGYKRREGPLGEASLYTLLGSLNPCVHFVAQTLSSEAVGHSPTPWAACPLDSVRPLVEMNT